MKNRSKGNEGGTQRRQIKEGDNEALKMITGTDRNTGSTLILWVDEVTAEQAKP